MSKTIFLFALRTRQSDRDRYSGVFRYLNARNDVTVVRYKRNVNGRRELRNILAKTNPLKTGLIFCSAGNIPDVPPPYKAIVFSPDTVPLPNNISAVSCDNATVARAAADFLIARGHTIFGYVGYACDDKHSQQRGNAFATYLEKSGFSCPSFNLNSGNSNKLIEFILQLPKPCGIFAYNDYIAQDVLDACHKAHLNVPEQVNIIGVDNDESICECLKPTLTSIQIDFEESGYIAAELILEQIEHPQRRPQTQYYGPLRLIERESTQDVNGSRRLVTNACIWLNNHFAEHVSVQDLAHEMHTCRRRLEIRFKEILGHTVHDELEQLRIEKAQKLLVSTKRALDEIAMSCGYTCGNTFRNAFKARSGLTPSFWRKVNCGSVKE